MNVLYNLLFELASHFCARGCLINFTVEEFKREQKDLLPASNVKNHLLDMLRKLREFNTQNLKMY